ncbi:ribonuclease P protein subunit p29-like [Lontra canadensis]|uniref:ribonuclease P protein subunit p29-like n=1 Tax=Lontra canadensis TaxID=76717 RepID=UPI0013F3709F|nr:ribonuclease P protein subunit p29-like [Lontra canadensis]
MKSVIYHAFSQKEAKELDVQLPGAQQAEAFVRAFLKRSTPRMSQQAREDQLQRKAVVLEYATRRKRKEKRKKSKGLSARQWRELHLFDIKPERQGYARAFLPFSLRQLPPPGVGVALGDPVPLKLRELLPLPPRGGSLPFPTQAGFALGFHSKAQPGSCCLTVWLLS